MHSLSDTRETTLPDRRHSLRNERWKENLLRQAKETMRMLGLVSAAARAEQHVVEALMNETPEEVWRRWLVREYPDIRKKSE